MTCSWCLKYWPNADSVSKLEGKEKNKYSFLTGCDNFRASSLSSHEESNMHQEAVKVKLAKETPVQQSKAGVNYTENSCKKTDGTKISQHSCCC